MYIYIYTYICSLVMMIFDGELRLDDDDFRWGVETLGFGGLSVGVKVHWGERV